MDGRHGSRLLLCLETTLSAEDVSRRLVMLARQKLQRDGYEVAVSLTEQGLLIRATPLSYEAPAVHCRVLLVQANGSTEVRVSEPRLLPASRRLMTGIIIVGVLISSIVLAANGWRQFGLMRALALMGVPVLMGATLSLVAVAVRASASDEILMFVRRALGDAVIRRE